MSERKTECLSCGAEFGHTPHTVRRKDRSGGRVVATHVRCPECMASFKVNGDVDEYLTHVADGASTAKPTGRPGKRHLPKESAFLSRYQTSSDWNDYEGPHLHLFQKEVEYFNDLQTKRVLLPSELAEYAFWKDSLEDSLKRREEAERRLRERGEL